MPFAYADPGQNSAAGNGTKVEARERFAKIAHEVSHIRQAAFQGQILLAMEVRKLALKEEYERRSGFLPR